MARLRDEEWLHLAKSIPIGSNERFAHRGDRTMRPNLLIRNEPDKWSAWCMSCKVGGTVAKTHVRMDTPAPAKSADLSLPRDMTKIISLDGATQFAVASFLARKNMDLLLLPPAWYSPERKRILLDTGQGWLGRDVTEKSDQKWLTYNRTQYLGAAHPGTIVVVEDPFSYYKVLWALQDLPEYGVVCALGTQVKDSLALKLLHSHMILVMFDGDGPGRDGAAKAVVQMRGLGVKSAALTAPLGKDPKDMTALQIREHLINGGGLSTR